MLPIYLEITLVLLRRCLKVKKVPKIVAPHFPQDSYATQIFLWAMLMLLMNLCGFTVVPLQLCWCLARSSAGFLCLHVHLHFPPLPQILYAYSKYLVVPGKNASQTSLGCLCSKTFCKILDKAAEDLSNLRKSTEASSSDAIELSDEYIECLLSSFSESQKLDKKYLIEHGYSSMILLQFSQF